MLGALNKIYEVFLFYFKNLSRKICHGKTQKKKKKKKKLYLHSYTHTHTIAHTKNVQICNIFHS